MSTESGQTLPNSASVAGGDIKVTCPKCGELRGSRMKRRGFFQKQVLAFLGYFPWQCGSCRFQWNSKARGEKRRRRSSSRGPKAFVEPNFDFNAAPPAPVGPQPNAYATTPLTPPKPAAKHDFDHDFDDTHDDVE